MNKGKEFYRAQAKDLVACIKPKLSWNSSRYGTLTWRNYLEAIGLLIEDEHTKTDRGLMIISYVSTSARFQRLRNA